MIELIDEIVGKTVCESQSNPVLKDENSALEAISIDLNIFNIENKKLNAIDFGGYNYHPFLIAREKNIYFLIDWRLKEKCREVNDESFTEYLNSLGISNNISIREIYNRSNKQ